MTGNTMSEPTPLPCPFCGSIPRIIKGDVYSRAFVIRCENAHSCAARPRLSRKTEQETVEAWNTRHTPEAVAAPKVDEQLEEDIELIQIGCPITTDDMELYLSAIARTILHLLKR